MRTSALALLLFLFVAACPAFAQDPCAFTAGNATPVQLANSDSGMSGTGRNGGDESGLGGTGYTGTDESGLGGTGYEGGDDSGIGGTGIFGTITGFGSICVNGLRIQYDDTTPISQDGEASTVDVLALGQVVAIEATGAGENLRAESVAIQSVLVGAITAVDDDTDTIYVMDQSVMLPEGLRIDLAGGTRVAVSGLRRGDGIIDASRVSVRHLAARDAVSGIARWIDGESLEVGGVQVAPERASLSDVDDGAFVRAVGTWNSERSTLEAATVRRSRALGRSTVRLSLEGYVERLPGDARAWIGGVEIDAASLDRIVVRPDAPERIRISGVRDRNGRVRIERIERAERPMRIQSRRQPPVTKVEARPRPVKPEQKVRPIERVNRPGRQLRPEIPQRPPLPDRPEKPDRPTVIDEVRRNTDTRP